MPLVGHPDKLFVQEGVKTVLQRQKIEGGNVKIAADVRHIDHAVADQANGIDGHEKDGFRGCGFQETAEVVDFLTEFRFNVLDVHGQVLLVASAEVPVVGFAQIGFIEAEDLVAGIFQQFGDVGHGGDGVEGFVVLLHSCVFLMMIKRWQK